MDREKALEDLLGTEGTLSEVDEGVASLGYVTPEQTMRFSGNFMTGTTGTDLMKEPRPLFCEDLEYEGRVEIDPNHYAPGKG